MELHVILNLLLLLPLYNLFYIQYFCNLFLCQAPVNPNVPDATVFQNFSSQLHHLIAV